MVVLDGKHRRVHGPPPDRRERLGSGWLATLKRATQRRASWGQAFVLPHSLGFRLSCGLRAAPKGSVLLSTERGRPSFLPQQVKPCGVST